VFLQLIETPPIRPAARRYAAERNDKENAMTINV
jgi:hypothetical protein